MNNKAVKVFLSVTLALVVVFGAVAIGMTVKNGRSVIEVNAPAPFAERFGKKDKTEDEPPASAAPSDASKTPSAPQQQTSLRMLSVGDNLIHDGIYEQAQKRAKNGGYDFSFCYARVKSIVEAADIATINQETIVSKSYPLFNSPQELGAAVKDTGFDVVALANNHMLDKTAKGLTEAIDFWDAAEGITRTGAYKDKADLDRVEYIEKNGIKIGLVGITQYLNGLSLPKDSPLQII